MVDLCIVLVVLLLFVFSSGCDASIELEMDFDQSSGLLSKLLVNGWNVIESPALDVGLFYEAGVFPLSNQWKLVSINRKNDNITVVRRAEHWQVTTNYFLNGGEIKRRAIFKWLGPAPIKIYATQLLLPHLRLSNSTDDYYLIPSSFPINKMKFSDLQKGKNTAESWWIHGQYAVSVVHSRKKKLSVLTGYIFEMDEADVSVVENMQSIDIVYRFNTSALLQSGDEIDTGTQVVRFVEGDEDRLKIALSELSNSLLNGPPTDVPEHLKRSSIYEVHPWGRLESWGVPDSGNRYSRITSLMTYYQKLGISILWLLPLSWHPPWVYTLPEFDRIDPQNGTSEELKALIDTAHKKDMHILVDLVTYGINPSSSEVARLPADAWCYDRNSERVLVWGDSVLAADCSSPAWQRRIDEVAGHWARDFGFDGSRLDVIGWGQVENWNNPLRMNASIAYGGLQLNRIIRNAMREHNLEAVQLPEGAKPLVFRNSDMVFGYPLYMKMREMTLNPDLALWISDIQNWLEYEKLCYPSRAMHGIVRFIENHDNVPSAQYFGVGPSQALMAVCTFIQGIPFIYQEQEIGYSQDISAWLSLRRNESCFYEGEAFYTCIKCSNPNVLCFLRKSSVGAGIVAVNFTGKDIKCTITWERGLAKEFPDVFEAFSGKIVDAENSARIKVTAFRPYILLLKPKNQKPTNFKYELSSIAKYKKVQPVQSAGVFEFTDAKRWFVDSAEGYLEDDFNSLFTKTQPDEDLLELLPVLKRSWNALESGLLDGASKASLGVIDNENRVARAEFNPNTVAEAKIVNREIDGKRGSIVVVPQEQHTEQADSRLVSKLITVTPQFVHMKLENGVLSLARRHGGFPAALKRNGTKNVSIIGASDIYTDYGIFLEKGYFSVDGETNPRLSISTDNESLTVRFEGFLYGKAWNTVQSCPISNPKTKYALSYTVDNNGSLLFRISLIPAQDIQDARAFFACRMPVNLLKSWSSDGRDVEKGAQGLGRMIESSKNDVTSFILHSGAGDIRVDSFVNLQNVFMTNDNSLFIALLDGLPAELKSGVEYSGSVRITLL